MPNYFMSQPVSHCLRHTYMICASIIPSTQQQHCMKERFEEPGGSTSRRGPVPASGTAVPTAHGIAPSFQLRILADTIPGMLTTAPLGNKWFYRQHHLTDGPQVGPQSTLFALILGPKAGAALASRLRASQPGWRAAVLVQLAVKIIRPRTGASKVL
jgi:hypothetical protein